ncbi:hypothetical protein ACNTMW_03470 [Planosporangium sp. 12N6]|uniref:hypothetical protein n=1 Tax=Planosporangium spinosum TaxID=3402278 RepID=UPI003CF0B1ED
MTYASDLTDEQWALLEPVFNAPGKRGPRHAPDLLELRRVGWDDKQPVFRPIRHAWRVEVAHGRLGRSRRLAKSFESTTTSATGWLQVACIATTLRHLSRVRAQRALPLAA